MKRQGENAGEMTDLDILRGLVPVSTVSPSEGERTAVVYLKELLELAGFLCRIQRLGDGRANSVA